MQVHYDNEQLNLKQQVYSTFLVTQLNKKSCITFLRITIL